MYTFMILQIHVIVHELDLHMKYKLFL